MNNDIKNNLGNGEDDLILHEDVEKNFSFKSNNNLKSSRSSTSTNNEKSIDRVLKKIKELNNSLEVLDFNIEKFNRFQSSLKSFKIWNTLTLTISGFMVGIISSSFLFTYFQSESKNKEVVNMISDYRILIGKNKDNKFQIYSSKSYDIIYQTDEYSVLENKNK